MHAKPIIEETNSPADFCVIPPSPQLRGYENVDAKNALWQQLTVGQRAALKASIEVFQPASFVITEDDQAEAESLAEDLKRVSSLACAPWLEGWMWVARIEESMQRLIEQVLTRENWTALDSLGTDEVEVPIALLAWAERVRSREHRGFLVQLSFTTLDLFDGVWSFADAVWSLWEVSCEFAIDVSVAATHVDCGDGVWKMHVALFVETTAADSSFSEERVRREWDCVLDYYGTTGAAASLPISGERGAEHVDNS